MHYLIDGLCVESELAARATLCPNKHVLKYISEIPVCSVVLDYGCGKMRHTIPLSKQVACVYAVDSKEQIHKIQTINEIRTSVYEYSKQYASNIFVYDAKCSEWKNVKYDRVLLTNVLSAVPFYDTRIDILENIYSVLKDDGEVLITTQYRNSDYSKYKFRTSCQRYYDGWLMRRSESKYAFYGLVTPESIVELCSAVGLVVSGIKKSDGSVYVKASH
jgi:SAM-dependent methyltransferase